MHVLSIKTGLKLAALLVLGILLLLSLTLLVYKSYRSLTREKTTTSPAENHVPNDRARAEKALAILLEPKNYPFVKGSTTNEYHMEIKVDSRMWRQLSSKDKKSYLHGIADARAVLGHKPEVKILDTKTSVEMSSYEHGRVILGEDQDGS